MGACLTRVDSKNTLEIKSVYGEDKRIISIQNAIDISPDYLRSKRTPTTRDDAFETPLTTASKYTDSSVGLNEEWKRGKMTHSKSRSEFKRPRFKVNAPLSLSNLNFSNFESDNSINTNRYWIDADEESDYVPPGVFEDRPKTTHIHGSLSSFTDVSSISTPYDLSPSIAESPGVGGSAMSPVPSDSSPTIRPILESIANRPKMEHGVQSLPANILQRRRKSDVLMSNPSPGSNIECRRFIECRDQLVKARKSSNLSIEKFELIIQRAEELFETARYSLKEISDEEYQSLWPHMCILRKQVKQWKTELKQLREQLPDIEIPASSGEKLSSIPEHVL